MNYTSCPPPSKKGANYSDGYSIIEELFKFFALYQPFDPDINNERTVWLISHRIYTVNAYIRQCRCFRYGEQYLLIDRDLFHLYVLLVFWCIHKIDAAITIHRFSIDPLLLTQSSWMLSLENLTKSR